MPRMGGASAMPGLYLFRTKLLAAGRRLDAPSGRCRLLVGGCELSFDGLEMRSHLGIAVLLALDLADGAHYGGVIAVAEGTPELGEAALEARLAQVHGDVPRERDALVTILGEQIV